MASRHLAITMGDPAGIGPEIIVKACIGLQDRSRSGDLRLLIIGSDAALEQARAQLGAGARHPAGERRGRRLARSLCPCRPDAERRADPAGRAVGRWRAVRVQGDRARACAWRRPGGSAASSPRR